VTKHEEVEIQVRRRPVLIYPVDRELSMQQVDTIYTQLSDAMPNWRVVVVPGGREIAFETGEW
jgi:hypothetical protein